MQYRIKSTKLSLGKEGELVDEKNVPEDVNLAALLEGGHLEPATTKASKPSDKE